MKILNLGKMRFLMVVLTTMVGGIANAGNGSHGCDVGGCCDDNACCNDGISCDSSGCFGDSLFDDGCDACGGCEGNCRCDARRWYLGVEATFLAPLYDDGAASFSVTDIPGATTATIGSAFDQADDLTGAPRLTLGYGGRDGVGIQARYWEINPDNAGTLGFPAPVVPGVNRIESLGGSSTFEAYTIDLELTKEFCRRGWDLLGTFGVRHASYDRGRSNAVAAVVNGDVYSLGSLQNASFDGTGLTFSLAGLKPLKRQPCLSLFASARGSTVWGQAESLAVSHSSVVSPGGNAGATNGALGFGDETLFIAELSTGMQYSKYVRSFNARMFARAAFEYQFWTTDDPTAVAVSASTIPGNSLGVASVSGSDQDFDLIGFSIMTGFYW